MLNKIRKLLLAPLVRITAFVLLCEEWLGKACKRVIARLHFIPFMSRLESHIENSAPLTLRGVLMFPVRIFALLSAAGIVALAGRIIAIGTKKLGTALFARLYGFARNLVMSSTWFIRGRDSWRNFIFRILAQLRTTRAWQLAEKTATALIFLRGWWWLVTSFTRDTAKAEGPGGRLSRIIKRIAARRRKRS